MKTQTSHYENGRRKAQAALSNTNPDGTVSTDEDSRMQSLKSRAEQFVRDCKKECYDIGGSFRGPGYWAEVLKILR
jgi:hypothetical protein